MIKKRVVLFLVCWVNLINSNLISADGERRFIVVTASYNNQKYYERNLSSVFMQTYKNYHIVYINDCSTDNTLSLVRSYVKKYDVEDFITIIANDTRVGALENQYKAIWQYCNDTDVVVIVDGDDWLANSGVFAYLNSVYANPNVWLTYGQFVQYPTGDCGWCQDMPREVVVKNAFRKYTHNPGHLRTFYAGLFKQIRKEDLMHEGDFLKMCADNAVMLPMIEMARKGHFKFIEKVLLVWNGESDINDHKTIPGLQQKLDFVIRTRSPYDPVETPFRKIQ